MVTAAEEAWQSKILEEFRREASTLLNRLRYLFEIAKRFEKKVFCFVVEITCHKYTTD